MNLELLDPWEQEYPQVIEETLTTDGCVVTCKFNRRGTLLAAGCQDGRCVVWDFDTRGVARNLIGHVKVVTSVSWSRNGRHLLSASKDWNCIFWDLLSGMKQETIRFATHVLMAQMHPRNNAIFVAALYQEAPVLVDMSDGKITRYELPTEMEEDEDENTSEKEKESGIGNNNSICVVCFDRRGDRILCGTTKGFLNIIDVKTRKIISSERITNTSIKHINFSRKGKHFVTNANDRIIRVFTYTELSRTAATSETQNQSQMPNAAILSTASQDFQPPILQNKFQDLVNRVQWNQACFSADGEFVVGGSAHKAGHNIYIWDKNMGNLVKILEGRKEVLEDLVWHPIRPIIASVSSRGQVYIWATNHEENWSAFAPDFKELEENSEYTEREDEFDKVPEEEVTKRKKDDEDNVFVDVTTIDHINPFNDSDEDEPDEVFYLPTRPEEDSENDPGHSLDADEELTTNGGAVPGHGGGTGEDEEIGEEYGSGEDSNEREIGLHYRRKGGTEKMRRKGSDDGDERSDRANGSKRKKKRMEEW